MVSKCIFIISDSIGETAEKMTRAALGQFPKAKYVITKHSFVESEEQVRSIMNEASERRAMVLFTVVKSEIRKEIQRLGDEYGICYFDIMTPMMDKMAGFLEMEPVRIPGTIHKLDLKYFDRVEAMEFAVKYDDGKDPRGVKKADIVLLGVSRTSKTPLSMYLANKSVRVANIPLVPEIDVPKEIFEADPKKIVGLTNNPRILGEIRKERLRSMGFTASSDYSDQERIEKELKFANRLFNQLGIPVIDVANKAIEETANIIYEIYKKNGANT